MSRFQIAEIFRSPNSKTHFEFVLLLFKDKMQLKKVKSTSINKLINGSVYKNDYIEITEDTTEGIDFEVIDTQSNIDVPSIHLVEYIYGPDKHLPFLNDTLPYYDQQLPIHEIEKLNASTYAYNNIIFYNSIGNLSTPIIGKMIYKTRINQTNTTTLKYYFFMILEINNELLKVVIWRENIKYSSLKVGDVIGLQKYRVNKGYSGQLCLDYNKFSEAAYFDSKEVTGTEILKFDTALPDGNHRPILESIKGFISYKSVINRRCHGVLDEFYLLVVDKKPVVLFYNSDQSFYEIEAGSSIQITNLREVERAGFTFFISSIFTQIELDKATVLDDVCSSFLYEGKKRKYEEDSNVKKRKEEEDSNVKKRKDEIPSECESTEVSFLEKIVNREDRVVEKNKSFVEIAVGYLPDNFSTVDDVFREEKELLNQKEYSVPMFYRPIKSTVADLKGRSLIINEVTKWLIKAELCEVDFSNYNDWEEQTLNDGVCISYIKDGVIKEQLPAFIKIKDDVDMICYLMPNYLTGETELIHLYNMFDKSNSYEDVISKIGKTFYFVVQAFRASDENILYIITGIISE